MSAADAPDQLHLALHGSGQSLYVGLAEDAFVVASELYGVVQETARYVPMDGEGGAEHAAGQIVVLDRAGAGTLAGVRRMGYDAAPRPLDEKDIRLAQITARDIDRAGFPHFLLKEIFEARQSSARRCEARSSRRRTAAGSACRSGPKRCHRRSYSDSPTAPSRASASLPRARPPSPARASRRRSRPRSTRLRSLSTRCWRRSCPASPLPTT